MGKVAIISKNKELIRFVELELGIYGYGFELLDRVPSIPDAYDFCIVDTDTADVIPTEESDMEIMCVCAPVSLSELDAFCAHKTGAPQMRHGQSASAADAVYVEDERTCTVRLCNTQIKLTRAEYELLITLCEAKGKAVSREQIRALFGTPSGNIADVYICSLRKKLERATSQKVIFTERSRGYRTKLRLVR